MNLKLNFQIIEMLIKLSNKFKDKIDVNIIKIFSDIVLTNKLPFSKLILDEYSDTYYKILKIIQKSY